MSEKVTERQVREFLGIQADNWSEKGVKFLKLRLCGTRWREATRNALAHYAEGTLEQLVPEEVNKEVASVFGMTKAEPERLIIIGLGRPAHKSKGSGWQEKQTSLLKIDEELIANAATLEEKARDRLNKALAQKHVSEKLFAMFDPLREQREAEAAKKVEQTAKEKEEAKGKRQASKAKIGKQDEAEPETPTVDEVITEEQQKVVAEEQQAAPEMAKEEVIAEEVPEVTPKAKSKRRPRRQKS